MKKKTIQTAAAVGMVTGAALGGGALLYAHFANQLVGTTHYTFRSGNLPEEFSGFRIAQVSDLQSQYYGIDQVNLLHAVREANPDIIVITGDLVDRNHTDFMATLRALTGLLKIAPVYYENGNHELLMPEAKIRPFFEEMKHMGVRFLFDEVEVLHRGDAHINLMGVSEYSLFAAKEIGWELGKKFESSVLREKLHSICEATEKDDAFTMMLVHEPQYIDAYATVQPDLIFCGHAHGGQFRLPNGQGLFAPGQGVLPKLTQGLHRRGNSTMVISRGLGNSRFPIRLNNRPELVVVTLE